MPKDSELISSQTHELNYLLKKWGKKQSRENRQILRDTLKDFRADEAYKPHTREYFYKYVEDHDILNLLEDVEKKKSPGRKRIVPDVDMDDLTVDEPYMHKAGKKKIKIKKPGKQKIQIQDLTTFKNRKTGGKMPGEKVGKPGEVSTRGLNENSKKKFLLLLIIILIVILIITIITVGTCMYQNAQAKKTDPSAGEDTTGVVQPTDDNDQEGVPGIEKERYTRDTLKDYIGTCTPIYFKGDLDEFRKGEDVKIEKLATYLDNYANVDLSIEGHTASIGQPENEMDLSRKRASHVADFLQQKTGKVNLTIKTTGYGAAMEVIKNPTKNEMKLNRRVEIVVIKADSDE